MKMTNATEPTAKATAYALDHISGCLADAFDAIRWYRCDIPEGYGLHEELTAVEAAMERLCARLWKAAEPFEPAA